jgi:hypothetical protein
MKVKILAFVFSMLVASWSIPSLSFSEVTVTGVTKSFNPQSGRLVITTTSQAETTVTIPPTVKVYLKTQDEDIEVSDADKLKFLKDNLFRGTGITIQKTQGVVTAIWVLEVPS